MGYCGEGSFQLPLGPKPAKANLRKQWCEALGIRDEKIIDGGTDKTRILHIGTFPNDFATLMNRIASES